LIARFGSPESELRVVITRIQDYKLGGREVNEYEDGSPQWGPGAKPGRGYESGSGSKKLKLFVYENMNICSL